MNRAFLFTISFLFMAAILYSTPNQTLGTTQTIDFYGVASPDIEDNMIKMTCDLYYNQLKDAAPAVRDMRGKINSRAKSQNEITFSEEETSALIFYAFIAKLPTGKWCASMFLKNRHTATTFSYSKEYDSYYKILMESKSSLVSILDNLILQQKGGTIHSDLDDGAYAALPTDTERVPFPEEPKKGALEISDISGTWTGDGYISKVVIMRNGRGFVILRNGVSMNISIVITSATVSEGDSSEVHVQQVGSSNAAFFAELPRDAALEAAKVGDPIEWNFSFVSPNRMTGKKKTLAVDSSTGLVTRTLEDCEWVRQ